MVNSSIRRLRQQIDRWYRSFKHMDWETIAGRQLIRSLVLWPLLTLVYMTRYFMIYPGFEWTPYVAVDNSLGALVIATFVGAFLFAFGHAVVSAAGRYLLGGRWPARFGDIVATPVLTALLFSLVMVAVVSSESGLPHILDATLEEWFELVEVLVESIIIPMGAAGVVASAERARRLGNLSFRRPRVAAAIVLLLVVLAAPAAAIYATPSTPPSDSTADATGAVGYHPDTFPEFYDAAPTDEWPQTVPGDSYVLATLVGSADEKPLPEMAGRYDPVAEHPGGQALEVTADRVTVEDRTYIVRSRLTLRLAIPTRHDGTIIRAETYATDDTDYAAAYVEDRDAAVRRVQIEAETRGGPVHVFVDVLEDGELHRYYVSIDPSAVVKATGGERGQ